MRRLLFVTMLLCALPAYAAGNASIMCTYFALDDGHEMLRRCGKVIEPDRNQRYAELHSKLKQFIYKNGPPNVRHLLAEEKQGTRDRLAKQDICEGEDFLVIKRMFEHLTSAETTAKILESLKTLKDPLEGDCL